MLLAKTFLAIVTCPIISAGYDEDGKLSVEDGGLVVEVNPVQPIGNTLMITRSRAIRIA